MPDGDVFDRQLRRGWKTASRRMIGAGEGVDALPSVIRALSKELKADGCPGLDEVVSVVESVIRSPQPRAARSIATAQLEDVRLQYGNRSTELAIKSAKHFLAALTSSNVPAPWEMSDGDLRIQIASAVLADIADARMCPAVALQELIEGEHASFQEIDFRRQQSKELVTAASETRRMAV